jgi:hypothetical protein
MPAATRTGARDRSDRAGRSMGTPSGALATFVDVAIA